MIKNNHYETKESFKFYVDDMPDWFFYKITIGEVELIKCDYRRYGIEEASCIIKKDNRIIKIIRGGEIIDYF